jgi:hypothetical protein
MPKIITHNLSGTVYASLSLTNEQGGYIAHGKTVQEAIAKLFAIYNYYQTVKQ